MTNIIDIKNMYITKKTNEKNGNENFIVVFNDDIKFCIYDYDIRIFTGNKLKLQVNTYPINPELFISQMSSVFKYKNLFPHEILIEMNKKI